VRMTMILMSLAGLVAAACDSDDDSETRTPWPGAPGASPASPASPCACPASPGQRVTHPLECGCGASALSASQGSTFGVCQNTRETFRAQACSAGVYAVVQMTGCGKVTLMVSGGFSGTSPTYDQASGRLVGLTEYSDAGFGECRAFQYRFGDVLRPGGFDSNCDPAQVQFCLACGDRRLLAHGSNVDLPYPIADCP
jgi:hypothetical protein